MTNRQYSEDEIEAAFRAAGVSAGEGERVLHELNKPKQSFREGEVMGWMGCHGHLCYSKSNKPENDYFIINARGLQARHLKYDELPQYVHDLWETVNLAIGMMITGKEQSVILAKLIGGMEAFDAASGRDEG